MLHVLGMGGRYTGHHPAFSLCIHNDNTAPAYLHRVASVDTVPLITYKQTPVEPPDQCLIGVHHASRCLTGSLCMINSKVYIVAIAPCQTFDKNKSVMAETDKQAGSYDMYRNAQAY